MQTYIVPASQQRSPAGRWMEKVQSAPEIEALNMATKEDTPERRLRIRKQQVLAGRETAFLYAHLGEPGSSVFESFDRLGEIAAEQIVLTAVVEGWSRLGE
ncbi:hypothetical protein [Frigoribacterium sp. UYMn621]|uniref:hypothetical protein n=1 Tax=Frigoribacterium sp. UYMn621 TaxID=3156343 RepID=UPI00339B62ED